MTSRPGRLLWGGMCAAGATYFVAPAAPVKPQERPPSLVVLVVVDQMRADYLERYSRDYSGGFARLAREGARFTEAYQDHGVTETAPGHSTLLSGRHPRSTYIVRNEEGVPDRSSPLLETAGTGASPFRFHGTALIDWMRAGNPGTRALSVSRKDRGAIPPVGRSRESVWWFAGGRFTTSTWYADSLPAWVRSFNAEVEAWRSTDRTWDLLLPSASYSEPDDAVWEHGWLNRTFPHRLGPGGDIALEAWPWLDSLVMAMALRGVQALDLGSRGTPELLVVSLSQIDATGHGFGPHSREVHDHLVRLDRWLGVFLDSLESLRGAGRLLVALTGDHGVEPYPEWWHAQGFADAGWLYVDSLLLRYRAALVERAGPGRWVRWRSSGLVGIDRAGLERRGIDVDSLAEAMRGDLARVPGVLRVDTRRTLARVDTVRDAIGRRWRNAVPDSSLAELMITPREKWSFGQPGGDASHGHLWDAPAGVPLVLWGPGIRAGRYRGRVSTVDIGPTLARVLGVRPLEPLDGRVLAEALDGSVGNW